MPDRPPAPPRTHIEALSGMNILIDTSVWIRALAGRPTYRDTLDSLLDLQLAVGHDLIYGELLIGDKGGRRRLLDEYARMPCPSAGLNPRRWPATVDRRPGA